MEIIILAFGDIPIDALSEFSRLAGKQAVHSTVLSKMSGATIACGDQARISKLVEALKPGAIAAKQGDPANSMLLPEEVEWLAYGERGASSNTLFKYATGVNACGDYRDSYPHNPDDLRRCRLLLEKSPRLRDTMHQVANAGPQWMMLLAHWDAVCGTMDAECPKWREGKGGAPATYKLMKQLFETVEAKP